MNEPNHGNPLSHILRPKIQPGATIHARQAQPSGVPDIEEAPNKYIALALVHLKNQMARLAKMIGDESRPVDEYNTQTLAPELETLLIVQPQWEVTEIIKSIIIVGPGIGGVFTLQLGDRIWSNVTLPSSGVLVIAPVAIALGRSDVRQLVANTPGEYSLELMGHCDERAG